VSLHVIYEDNHLLAVAKPPGVVTQGAAEGETSVVTLAKDYLRQKYQKPGNVYLGVVSRLDSPTSGVVLLARTSKAAARLSEQFRSRKVEKIYWAVVEGEIEPPAGELVDWLLKNEKLQRMEIVPAARQGAQEARLAYRKMKTLAGKSLLEVLLETGRKHQIRVQLASHGHPVVGDRKYGSRMTFAEGIALHCRRLVIEHPVKHTRLELIAPLPKAWKPWE
jgi:23S rRNA pseudouridine1911/1915/1917 synthase